MLELVQKISEKALLFDKQLIEASEKFNLATTQQEKELYIREILHIFDSIWPLIAFVMQNDEKICDIVDGQQKAASIYKNITGKEYHRSFETEIS